MASESSIEIIIRAIPGDTQRTLQTVEQAIKGLGTTSVASASQVKSAAAEVEGFGTKLTAFGVKVLGVLAGYTAFNQTARITSEILRSGVDDIDAMNKSATNLAIIMTTLARTPGPGTFAASMAYATDVTEKLRAKAAELGVTWKQMELEMRAAADMGVFPNSDKDIAAMAEIARAGQAIAVSRRGDMAALAQIKQLMDGQVSASNEVGRVLEANLGYNDKQLLQWIQIHAAESDFLQLVAKNFAGVAAAQTELNTLASNQLQLTKEHLATIQRTAEGGFYQSITNSLSSMNDFLQKNSSQISGMLTPAFDNLGTTISQITQFTEEHWQEITGWISDAGNFANVLLMTFQGLEMLASDISRHWEDIKNFVRDATPMGWAQMAGEGISRLMGQYGPNSLYGPPAAAVATSGGAGTGGGNANIPGGGHAGGDGSIPPHPRTLTPHIGPDTRGGGGNTAYQNASAAIKDQASYETQLAQGIDDNIARNLRLAEILKQEAASFAELAKTAATIADRRAAERESAVLLVEAATHERDARKEIATLADENVKKMAAAAAKVVADDKAAFDQRRTFEMDYVRDYMANVDYGLEYEKAQGTATLAAEIAAKQQELATLLAIEKQFDLDLTTEKRSTMLQLATLETTSRTQAAQEAAKQTKAIYEQMVADLKNQTEASAGLGGGFILQTTGGVQTLQAIGNSLQQQVALIQQQIVGWQRTLDYLNSVNSQTNNMTAEITTVTNTIDGLQKKLTATQWQPVINAVDTVTQQMESAFANFFDNILTKGMSFQNAIVGLFRSIGQSIVSEISQMVARAIVQASGLQQALTRLFSGLNTSLGGGMGSSGSVLGTLLKAGSGLAVPAFASGGIVSSRTLAMVGESGPEAIIPLRNLGGGGDETHFHFHINAIDTQSGMDFLMRHADTINGINYFGRFSNSPSSRG